VDRDSIEDLLKDKDSRLDPANGLYEVGVGRADVTGPAAGVNMMGYADPAQINNGIHTRLYSRAFVVSDGTSRLVYCSMDIGMTGQLVKQRVIEQLTGLYGPLYTTANVILSSTHTHSGPAGYMQYLTFQVTSLGFIDEALEAVVKGITQSIINAHEDLSPGRLYLSSGDLQGANINRSPSSYLENPEEERAQYNGNTDTTMTLVRVVGEDGRDRGMFNWFSVHGTSMNNTNRYVSSDNKGYASMLFEQALNPAGTLAGKGAFVAAFGQTNEGDSSPNTDGPKCQDTGLPCDLETSTCGGRNELCYAAGPGVDMMDSTRIIGQMQFDKAMELYKDSSAVLLKGPVQALSQQVDMTQQTVSLDDGTEGRTCPPALGYSFAAGTTDGPGMFDFTQGSTSGSSFWDAVVGAFLPDTTEEQKQCHAPKPVLLSTGQYHQPYEWHPSIVETQLGRIGQLAIAAVPGEFTTMSGRRMRAQVSSTFTSAGVGDVVPVIAGLSNIYTHYIATFEEYQAQRYEAASTLYGPHTLRAYLEQYARLAQAMVEGTPVSPGPTPPDLSKVVWSFLPPVIFDGLGGYPHFGSVLAEPAPLLYAGESVIVKFVSGHPRNSPASHETFLTVERQGDNGEWTVVATDADWQTRFHWRRVSTLLGTSYVTVSWDTAVDTPPGVYRLAHHGHAKTFYGEPEGYAGATQPFTLERRPSELPQRPLGPLLWRGTEDVAA